MRNLTNTGGDIFVNTMFGQGEAIEIVQQSYNTQALVNVSMKQGTTQATTLNDTDILIVADGSTGKVIQYISVADFKTAGTLWSLNGNQLYPDSSNYNVVIGTSNGTNNNGYGVLVLDKEIAIQTSAGSGSSNGLRIINDTYSVINYVDNAGNMFWSGATNNYNFSKQVIINTTGAELSNGTNTYTLPSSNGTLALVSQLPSGSNWTLNSTNLYPNSSSTNVVIGGTTNTNNRALYLNDDMEITGNLYFNNSDIYIDSNSQNIRNYVGYTAGNIGGQHLFYTKQSNGIHTEIGSIRTGAITSIGNPNLNSGNVRIQLYSASAQIFNIFNNDGGGSGGSPFVSFEATNDGAGGTSNYYMKWLLEGNEYMRLGTTGLTGANLYWKANKIAEIYGGTNQNTYTTGDILYSSASNTLSKLAIGSTGKVLKVVGGVPAWATESTTDLTTATDFATAVSGNTIKLGNSAGTAASAPLELYTSSTLKIYNTSNVNVATFTPVSNTCNLDLKGGLLTTFTASTNALWNGSVITDQYGGTGLSSYSVGDMLYVAGGIQPAGSLNKLAIGNAGEILKVVNGVPAWATDTAGTIWSRSSTTITPVNSGDTIDLVGETLLAYLIQGSGYNNECALRMGYYGSNELRGQITSGNSSINLTLKNTYNDNNANTDYTKYTNIGINASRFFINTNGVGDALYCNTDAGVQIPSGSLKIGTDAEHYELETNFTNNTFEIKEQDGTIVMKYDADTGYTDFCATAGARMDFKYNVLHGSEPAYPQGVNMPFGALSTMYGSAAYIKSITTDEITLSEYNGNPATISRYIRCNSAGKVYNQTNSWVGSLYGTQTQNYLEEYTTYGFQLRGTYYTNRSYNLWLINTGTGSNGGIIGCETEGMFIHMNGLGDAFKVYSENSKACCKVVNALRIDGFISTAGNGLTGSQGDGTCLSTFTFQPYSNSYWAQFAGSYNSFPYWDLWGTDYDPANINSTGVGLVCERGVFFKSGALFIACDRRLKMNITEIDDTFALDTLNKINMYRFKYKDCFNNNDEYTYNVIAQEVAQHFPQGVNYHTDFLPDIMSAIKTTYTPFTTQRLVKGDKDKPDEMITDNVFKMSFPINEKWEKDYIQKGKKYRFYCADLDTDFTNYKHEIKDIICEDDNTFVIDKEYKYVMLYGVEVNDLMSVDKQKLHSLQHSAIQELHKQNIKQQTEIDTLKEEVNGLKEILNKLVNSKSFADFKKTIA